MSKFFFFLFSEQWQRLFKCWSTRRRRSVVIVHPLSLFFSFIFIFMFSYYFLVYKLSIIYDTIFSLFFLSIRLILKNSWYYVSSLKLFSHFNYLVLIKLFSFDNIIQKKWIEHELTSSLFLAFTHQIFK